ncbi:MAG: hypothetical protein ACJ8AH_14595 [Stellaceae bacterium]|jgi:hypothetical protein
MRQFLIAGFMSLSLLPAAALAQTNPQNPQTAAIESAAPAAKPGPNAVSPSGITREQYLQRAQERAGHRAGTRFDQMDANHDGVLDRTEVRAWRSQHSRRGADQPSQPVQQ